MSTALTGLNALLSAWDQVKSKLAVVFGGTHLWVHACPIRRDLGCNPRGRGLIPPGRGGRSEKAGERNEWEIVKWMI